MIKRIYEKYHSLLWEIFRFCVVGFIATAVDYALFILFNKVILPKEMFLGKWDLNIGLATTVGFIGGVIVNYLLSVYYVFKNVKNKEEAKSTKNKIVFVVLGTIGLFIGLGIMQFGVVDLEWNESIVFVLKTGIVLVFNYITRKIFIFKS